MSILFMMTGRRGFLFSLILSSFHVLFVLGANALRPTLARRDNGMGIPMHSLHPLSAISAAQAGVGTAIDAVQGDTTYLVNITLGGQDFTVVLDSGSSDLWVKAQTPLKLTNDSGLTTDITYGAGGVQGPIYFAELQIGEYTVPSQAFMNASQFTPEMDGIDGLIGVAFDTYGYSSVEYKIKQEWGSDSTLGRTPLANLLNQNSSIAGFIDVSLGRSGDLAEYSEGTFVIGQHAPEFAAVAQAPKLPATIPGRWSAVVEGLSVNGLNYTFKTKAQDYQVPQGQLAGYLDTGTSYPEVPADVADFIYSNIPGSVNDNGTWFVPCHTGANLTRYLGGQAFPMHPLDLVVLTNGTFQPTSDSNITATVCIGAYQAGTPPYPGIDLVLGDNFLRNVYASFNFGSDIQNLTGETSFIQLLSTTDQEDAWVDFQLSRMDALAQSPFVIDPLVLQQLPGAMSNIASQTGLSVTPSPDDESNSDSSISTTPSSDGHMTSGALEAVTSNLGSADSSGLVSLLDKYGPVAIGLLAGNLAIMLALCMIAVVGCTRANGRKERSVSRNYVPVRFKDRVDEDPEFSAPVYS